LEKLCSRHLIRDAGQRVDDSALWETPTNKEKTARRIAGVSRSDNTVADSDGACQPVDRRQVPQFVEV